MNAEDGSWVYKPDGKNKSTAPELGENFAGSARRPASSTTSDNIEWSASEYIEHSRGIGWYLMLTVLTVCIAAGVYLLTKETFASVVTVLAAIVVVIFSFHKPGQTTYQLTNTGLSIGEKYYPYGSFKSFAVIREGGLNSINLVSLKRFMPPITIYIEAKDEKKIVEMLGQHLAYEQRGLDVVDRLTRRLRF